MSRAFIITPLAEDDMTDARRWYERQRAGLGYDFLDEVEKAFERVRRAPELAVLIYQDCRKVLVDRFLYHVIYRVDDAQITILAVYNARRDPSGWQTRI